MTPRQFLNTRPKPEVEAVCEAAGTTLRNLQGIAYQGRVGKNMAERLAKASKGVMTEMEILYPERYE